MLSLWLEIGLPRFGFLVFMRSILRAYFVNGMNFFETSRMMCRSLPGMYILWFLSKSMNQS